MTNMPTSDFRPIPQVYRGVRFRSRLEARWAVFFDQLAIDWRFEHEGQDGATRYLCDFFLPEFNLWIEIKPKVASEDEIGKCVRLSAAVADKVRLLYGPIGWWHWRAWLDSAKGGGIGFWRERDGEQWTGQADETVPLYCPCVCPECGMFGIEYRGAASRLACGHVKDDKVLTGDDKRILEASRLAANFQFDQGMHGPGFSGPARAA